MKKLIAMLLVLTMVLVFVGCAKADAPATEPAPVVTDSTTEATEAGPVLVDFAGFMAAEMDTELIVETYVQGNQAWWDGTVRVYCQGPDGAFFLYGMACTEEEAAKLVPGTKVRASGIKSSYSGQLELMEGTIEIIEGGDTYIAEAADLTALMGADEMIDHMSEKFSFKNVTIAPIINAEGNEVAFQYEWNGSGSQGDDIYFNLTDGTNTINCSINTYVVGTEGGSDVYKAAEALNIGDKVDVEGFMYWYEGPNPHITSIKLVTE